jgi:hypothetical protein
LAAIRIAIPEATRLEIIAKSNNRCCVCQTPFVQIHNLNEDPADNRIENLAPLCPNCHAQAGRTNNMINNLNADRIRALRDRWYTYCERRHEGSNIEANALLRLKNFVRSIGLAQHGWATTFATVDPVYETMTRDQIIDHVFATSNRNDLVTYLETVKYMYEVPRQTEAVIGRFTAVCNSFGIDYSELG